MMQDQADTLRRLMRERGGGSPQGEALIPRTDPPMPAVFTVASGKGGVGKSCLVANIGSMLARQGKRVLLVDGDFGLANLDILLGVQPSVTIEQVLDGEALIQEAIVGVEPNLWLLPAAAGLSNLRGADSHAHARFISLVEQCPWEMDVVIVDTGAGIQSNVLSLHSPLFNSLVVLTPEPTSLTDAYGLIKLLRRFASVTQVGVIVNQVTDGRIAQKTYQKLKDVTSRFIDVELEYFGHWQRDEKISQAVMRRKILLDLEEESTSIGSLDLIARKVITKSEAKSAANEEMSQNTAHGTVNLSNATGFFRTLLRQSELSQNMNITDLRMR